LGKAGGAGRRNVYGRWEWSKCWVERRRRIETKLHMEEIKK
jgi:hypothetical protein